MVGSAFRWSWGAREDLAETVVSAGLHKTPRTSFSTREWLALTAELSRQLHGIAALCQALDQALWTYNEEDLTG